MVCSCPQRRCGGGGGGGGAGCGVSAGGGGRPSAVARWRPGDEACLEASQAAAERPFRCPLCPHRARRKDSLIRHLRMHTGERPYRCPTCPYAAIQKSDLDRHLRSRHAHPFAVAHHLSAAAAAAAAPLPLPPQAFLANHSPPPLP